MPKRKRQQKGAGGSPKPTPTVDEDRTATELQESNDEAVTDEDLSAEEGPEAAEDDEVVASQRRKKSLRNFLKQAKTQHYRVIEMRVALVCSFGVFAKVIFSDALPKDEDSFITHAALTFAALCVLMMIVSTWLDYFPHRLREIKLRKVKSQGLPLACLLLPMVCCACLYFSLIHAQDFVALLTVYLLVLCVLSVCSILATLLHFIVYPNNITLFNFAVIGVALATSYWLKVSLWILAPSVSIYYVMVLWLLYSFPRSFTLGEAVIVAQGGTMLLVDTGLQLLKLHNLVKIPEEFNVHRHESLLYIELLVLGVIVCCILLSPALYKLSQSRQYYTRKFWSGTFILLSLSIGFMIILPWLARLLDGHHPIPLLVFSMFTTPVRLVLFAYWLMVSIATGIVITAQSSDRSWAAVFKSANPSSMWMRKWFHFFAFLVFLPGIALDPNFTSLVASVTAFLFLVAELCRYFKMWPFGETLYEVFQPLLDSKDSGSLVVSHIYLLLGFTLPIWLSPIRTYNGVTKLSLYSGVLALGVGDSMAALIGRLFGKTKWPGTEKTLTGTFASIIAQLIAVFIIILIDPHISFLSGRQWLVTGASIAITAALEAYTWQIDNLILGIFQFAILIAFL